MQVHANKLGIMKTLKCRRKLGWCAFVCFKRKQKTKKSFSALLRIFIQNTDRRVEDWNREKQRKHHPPLCRIIGLLINFRIYRLTLNTAVLKRAKRANRRDIFHVFELDTHRNTKDTSIKILFERTNFCLRRSIKVHKPKYTCRWSIFIIKINIKKIN